MIVMEVEELLREPRDHGADFHLLAGQAWRRSGEPLFRHSALVYAALEFRCAIERLVLELYMLIDPGVASHPEKVRDFGSLVALVHQDAGNKRLLWRTLTFNDVYARVVMELPFHVAVPDVGSLHRLWSALSEYCHRQLALEETWENETWVRDGYAALKGAEEKLWKLIGEERRGWLHVDTMPPEMQNERAHFLDSNDDVDTLERRLRLVKPVVRDRLNRERAST